MPKINKDPKAAKNSKSSFWQALVLTILVFLVGIFFGIAYEGNRLERINEYYIMSEVFLMDALTLSFITDLNLNEDLTCEVLMDSNIGFADRIYLEALLLEKYGESEQLTDSLKLIHLKYDLLRTILWVNTMNIPDECKEDVSIIVYLFERDTEDLTKKATNTVWSRILFDLKQDLGNKIILIPIGVGGELTSLNSLLLSFQISKYPTLVINEEHILTDIQSIEDIKEYLR